MTHEYQSSVDAKALSALLPADAAIIPNEEALLAGEAVGIIGGEVGHGPSDGDPRVRPVRRGEIVLEPVLPLPEDLRSRPCSGGHANVARGPKQRLPAVAAATVGLSLAAAAM